MKELAGHANYRTTEIYTHGDSVSKRHAVDALDSFLGELPPINGEVSLSTSDNPVEA